MVNKFLALLLGGFCIVVQVATGSSFVGFAEAQGRRPTMEDAHCIVLQPDYTFLGLYDGHGGKQVADFAAQHIHQNILAALKDFSKNLPHDPDIAMYPALEEGFLKTNQDLDGAPFNIRGQGCTAIVAVIKERKIYVANIGDSRAIVGSNGRAIALSSDHKPDRPDEKRRIERLGGSVIVRGVPRVNGQLAISRALGDKALHPYVIANPEIRHHQLTDNDDFLIIACDGVWDVIDNQTAVTIVKKSLDIVKDDVQKAADVLKNEALRRGSTDNVSVMIINLKQFCQ